MRIRKKQETGLSCGAATLLCAAIELGIQRMPSFQGSMYSQGQPLAATARCELGIYQMTSGVTTGSAPTNSINSAGYSYPHSIALAARVLGFSGVRVFMTPGFFATTLGVLYPRCESLCLGSGVPVSHQAPPLLRPDVRRLRIVGVFKGIGLHYVLERPDGTFMDPADGQDFPNLEATNNSWWKCYADTGICVDLSAPSVIDDTIRRQLARDQQNYRGGSREAPF